jgi:succinoglycan biosynthesis transport protein ExoP
MAEQKIEFKQYVQAVLKRFWLVVLMIAFAVGAAYMWPTPLSTAGRAPAQYTASTTLLLAAPPLQLAPDATGQGDASFRPNQSAVANDIAQLISSRTLAGRVAERLDISNPATVQRSISAAPVRGSSLLRVTATSRSPERAAAVANVASEELIAYFRETNRASMSEARRFVGEQLAQARARLDASDRAIEAFKQSRGMVSVETVRGQLMSAVASGTTAIDDATTAMRETEARLAAAHARLRREQPVMVSSRATSDNPVFRRFQDRLTDLELQRATLSQTYTTQHPRLETLAREITEVRSKLITEARTSIAQEVTATNPIHTRLVSDIVGLEVERAAAAARLSALQTVQRRREAAVTVIPSAETEFNRLVRENGVLVTNYTTLSTRYQDMLVRENQAGFYPASLQIIEAATLPGRAQTTFPRTAAAAVMVGLLLGIAGALFLETLDDRIRSANDAERVLGVPVLAEIPMQGAVRTAPSPAVLAIIGVIIAGSIAGAGYAYDSLGPTPGAFRSTIDTVASWVRGAPAGAEHVTPVSEQR